MKKKVIYIVTLLIIVLISLFFVKYWQHSKYTSSINNFSKINIESHVLKGMEYYSKGDFNCILIFNSNCDFCLDEVEDIVDNIEMFKNVNFYLVSDQTEEELIEYTEDPEFLGLENFTIIQDKSGEILKFFKYPEKPSTFMYAKNKKLIEYKQGFLPYIELSKMIE